MNKNNGRAKHEFKISNIKLGVDLCGVGVAILGSYYLALCLLIKAIRTLLDVFTLQSYVEVAIELTVLAIIMLLLLGLLFLSVLTTIQFVVVFRLFSIRIIVSDTGIEITNRYGIIFITESKLLYILEHPGAITLVWKNTDGFVTFYLSKKWFGAKIIEELAKELRRFDTYTNDIDRIKQIWKNLKLDHVFRKNKYEYQVAKLSKLAPLLKTDK